MEEHRERFIKMDVDESDELCENDILNIIGATCIVKLKKYCIYYTVKKRVIRRKIKNILKNKQNCFFKSLM